MSKNFLGHTRFSLYEPGSSSWRLTRKSQNSADAHDSYRSVLFSENRLGPRAEIFFNISLPILDQAANDVNLVHVVSYSEELPVKYRKMLKNAAQQYSWLKLDLRTSANRAGMDLTNFGAQQFGRGEIFGLYRLDDDDLLAPSFFYQCSQYLRSPFVGMVVSLPKGVQAFYHQGVFYGPRIENRPKIALGLLKICETKTDGTVKMPRPIAHPRTDERNPVILDARQISYVHTMHLSQDSGVDKPSDDLGKRYRNYNQLPKAGKLDIGQIPSVNFNPEDFPVSTKYAAMKTHFNQASLKALLTGAVRIVKRKIWLLVHSIH
ncbi:glycosyltransferase [Corynebacterium marquesiae]|uniref:glycosyltransferase n=1 Tax=Corynebacterium marquesiae TaxID=2913503 RepID=UPI00255179BC|nr:glycosyltransferase [Corynebacterium marquesiae]MDK8668964.1 glycosyltransferase [Corynebacterium marquesiae]